MSGVMQYEFRLFGPRKGQTLLLNGHQFIKGVCTLMQSSDNMGNAARVFSYYMAFARGTPEYDEALAAEEAKHGTGEIFEKAVEGINSTVSAGVQSDGRGSPEESAVPGTGDVITDRSDSAGSDSSRDGYEHAGVSKFPEDANYRAEEPASSVNNEITVAVMKLDPEIDSHWVLTGAHKGKPKLQAVEDAYGKANLTRQDLEAAMPGYDRKAAFEIALTTQEKKCR